MLERERIQPYPRNRFYWQYKGNPNLLLGGSVEDNLFQIPDIEEHLKLLASVGGNYVRCTMSSRDPGNVWPFEKNSAGLYDLNQPGHEYWRRFENFLNLTSELDIILQIELWDRFDFVMKAWEENPYNPKANVNYTVEESGLPEEIIAHGGNRKNPFFRSVPELENNEIVLKYQHVEVDKMLSLSLQYPNVLYCMDNETREFPAWPTYWSEYIKTRAKEAGVGVETTEMWDTYDIRSEEHAATFDHPETYSFIDVSQNNHLWDETHWNNPQDLRNHIIESGNIRPISSVKIYGATEHNLGWGSTRDAQERFWRNIFGGFASSRFHRPEAGIGLNSIAQTNIRAMRMLLEEFDIFRAEPHNDLLSLRGWNGSYCIANPGIEYAVYFTDGGNVTVDMHHAKDANITLRWLDIRNLQWHGEPSNAKLVHRREISGPTTRAQPQGEGPFLRLLTPTEEGYWVALIKVH